ncbi:hypothetical protein BWR19_15895 [Halomonas sp. 1513]|nr:hypothetical protein [Halomonas sp. 1513]APX94297.1 hypothetical protein BWR19_15895 [Halomonas sp. 1513]
MVQRAASKGVIPGLDPTLSPVLQALAVKVAINRVALNQARASLEQVREALGQMAHQASSLGDPAITASGYALATAQADQRRALFDEFTDALIHLARKHPPGAAERDRMMRIVEQCTELMAKAQKARRDELGALLRLDTLTKEANAQRALERNQGGGIH